MKKIQHLKHLRNRNQDGQSPSDSLEGQIEKGHDDLTQHDYCQVALKSQLETDKEKHITTASNSGAMTPNALNHTVKMGNKNILSQVLGISSAGNMIHYNTTMNSPSQCFGENTLTADHVMNTMT